MKPFDNNINFTKPEMIGLSAFYTGEQIRRAIEKKDKEVLQDTQYYVVEEEEMELN